MDGKPILNLFLALNFGLNIAQHVCFCFVKEPVGFERLETNIAL